MAEARGLKAGDIICHESGEEYPVASANEDGFKVVYAGLNHFYPWRVSDRWKHKDGAALLQKVAPTQPLLTKDRLARALFQTDPHVIGTVAHVGELAHTPNYEERRATLFQKAWDRDEGGRRTVAMRRADEVLAALEVMK